MEGGEQSDMPIDPDETKFKELLLYIATKCLDDPTYGATKLNKLLAFSDFMAYGSTGRPITGMRYQKLAWGPAARRLMPLQRELMEEGSAHLAVVSYGYQQNRLVALREPDLDLFSGREIAIVDEIVEHFKGWTGTRMSDYSHDWFRGWASASLYDDIPYETVFWRQPKMTPELIERAQQVAVSHGLLAES